MFLDLTYGEQSVKQWSDRCIKSQIFQSAQNFVLTLKQCCFDVERTSCAYWESLQSTSNGKRFFRLIDNSNR